MDVVGFGMIMPATLIVVDEFPAVNTGAYAGHVTEFTDDDAVIVASVLSRWGVASGVIGSALGDDDTGRRAVDRLRETGVAGEVRLTTASASPVEVNIADRHGNRTYVWQREEHVLDTLDTADLSPIDSARLVYADWYDGDRIVRPMKRAAERGVPVFLNFEHGHLDSELLARYAPYASVVQACTDAAQMHTDRAEATARRLLDAGVERVLVTLAGDGCLAATREEIVHVRPPQIEVVDGCTAGANFSAGWIYGWLNGWSMEQSTRFGVAAASLKCGVIGLQTFPVPQIQDVAKGLRAENLSVGVG